MVLQGGRVRKKQALPSVEHKRSSGARKAGTEEELRLALRRVDELPWGRRSRRSPTPSPRRRSATSSPPSRRTPPKKGGSSKRTPRSRKQGAAVLDYGEQLWGLLDQQEINAARTRPLMEWRGRLNAREEERLSRRRRPRVRRAAHKVMKTLRNMTRRGRRRRPNTRSIKQFRRRTAGGSRRR